MMPPCSPRETETIDAAAARLQEDRYAVDVEEFPTRPSPDPHRAAYASLSAVAALLVYPARLIAAVVGAAAVVLHARDSEGRPLLRQWSCTSRNVVARAPGAVRPALVVVASVPAPAHGVGSATMLRALVVALQVAMTSVAAAGAGAWVAEAGTELPRSLALAGAAGAVVIGALTVLLYGPRRRGSLPEPSALEALFRLAPELRGERVWLVVVGSTPTDGIAAFLDAHEEVAGASWINLAPGAETCAVSEEGTWRERRADRFLMGSAEEAGATVRPYRAAPTAATALLARRRRALTLMVPAASEALDVVVATARAALEEREPRPQ